MAKASKPDTAPVANAVPRETRYDGSDGVVVTMPRERAPGVRAFGPLKPGVEYVVHPDEAARLVRCKGFQTVNAAAAAATED